MGRMCVVFGCGISSGHKSGISTHAFPPPGSSYRRLWIKFVRTTRQDFVQPTKHQVICGRHFAEDSFEDQHIRRLKELVGVRQRRILKPDAVPTLLSDKCIAALSKHSPAAAATIKVKAVKKESSTLRERRITKREVMKDIYMLKKARMNAECTVQEESLHSVDAKHAILGCGTTTTSLQDIDIVKDEVPHTYCEEQSKVAEASAFNLSPRFKDAGVGTNIKRAVHHYGVMVNLKPHVRSKAVSVKPKQKSVEIQCDLCKCSKEAGTVQPPRVKLKVRLPAYFATPSVPACVATPSVPAYFATPSVPACVATPSVPETDTELEVDSGSNFELDNTDDSDHNISDESMNDDVCQEEMPSQQLP